MGLFDDVIKKKEKLTVSGGSGETKTASAGAAYNGGSVVAKKETPTVSDGSGATKTATVGNNYSASVVTKKNNSSATGVTKIDYSDPNWAPKTRQGTREDLITHLAERAAEGYPLPGQYDNTTSSASGSGSTSSGSAGATSAWKASNGKTIAEQTKIYEDAKSKLDEANASSTGFKWFGKTKELNDLAKQVEEAKAELDKMTKEKSIYDKALSYRDYDEAALAAEWDKLQKQREAEDGNIKTFDDLIAELTRRKNEINPGYALTSEAFEQQKKELDALQAEIDEYSEKKNAAQKAVDELRNQANDNLTSLQMYLAGTDYIKNKYGDGDKSKQYQELEARLAESKDTVEQSVLQMDMSLMKSAADYDRYLHFDVKAAEKLIKDIKDQQEQLDDEYVDLTDKLAYVRAGDESDMTEAQIQLRMEQIKSEQVALQEKTSGLREEISGAKSVQKLDPYYHLAENADFEKYAKQGAAIQNEDYNYYATSRTHRTDDWFAKMDNPAKAARDVDEKYASGVDDSYRYMTDDEYATYNYLLAKEGKTAAEKYHVDILDMLNMRKGVEMAENVQNASLIIPLINGYVLDMSEAKRAAGTIGTGATAGLTQFGRGVDNALRAVQGKELSATPAIQYASAQVREGLGQVGKPTAEGTPTLAQTAYDVLVTTSNMLPTIGIGMAAGALAAGLPAWAGVALSKVGAATMGISAGGNYYEEALQNGYDKNTAGKYAIMAGASEAALQAALGGIVSLGGTVPNLVSEKLLANIDSAWLRMGAELLVRNIGEGTEEYLQDVLTPVFYNIAAGERNTVQVFGNKEATYSFLLACVTTSLLEAGDAYGTTVAAAKLGKPYHAFFNSQSDLIKNAAKWDSDVGHMAQRVVQGDVRLTDTNLGQIIAEYGRLGEGNAVQEGVIGSIVENNPEAFSVIYAALQNPNALVMDSEAQYILQNSPGKDADWSMQQQALLTAVLNGNDLSAGGWKRLDVTNPAVQQVFSRKTGAQFGKDMTRAEAEKVFRDTLAAIQQVSAAMETATANAEAAAKESTERVKQAWAEGQSEVSEASSEVEREANEVRQRVAAVRAAVDENSNLSPRDRAAYEAQLAEIEQKMADPKTSPRERNRLEGELEELEKNVPAGRMSPREGTSIDAEIERLIELKNDTNLSPREIAEIDERIRELGRQRAARNAAASKKTTAQTAEAAPQTELEKVDAQLADLRSKLQRWEAEGLTQAAASAREDIARLEAERARLAPTSPSTDVSEAGQVEARRQAAAQAKKSAQNGVPYEASSVEDLQAAESEIEGLRNGGLFIINYNGGQYMVRKAKEGGRTVYRVFENVGSEVFAPVATASSTEKITDFLKDREPVRASAEAPAELTEGTNPEEAPQGPDVQTELARRVEEMRKQLRNMSDEELETLENEAAEAIRKAEPGSLDQTILTAVGKEIADEGVRRMKQKAATAKAEPAKEKAEPKKEKATEEKQKAAATKKGEPVAQAVEEAPVVEKPTPVVEASAEVETAPTAEEVTKAVDEMVTSETAPAEAGTPEWYDPSMGDLNDRITYRNGSGYTRQQWIERGMERFGRTAEEANAEFDRKLALQRVTEQGAAQMAAQPAPAQPAPAQEVAPAAEAAVTQDTGLTPAEEPAKVESDNGPIKLSKKQQAVVDQFNANAQSVSDTDLNDLYGYLYDNDVWRDKSHPQYDLFERVAKELEAREGAAAEEPTKAVPNNGSIKLSEKQQATVDRFNADVQSVKSADLNELQQYLFDNGAAAEGHPQHELLEQLLEEITTRENEAAKALEIAEFFRDDPGAPSDAELRALYDYALNGDESGQFGDILEDVEEDLINRGYERYVERIKRQAQGVSAAGGTGSVRSGNGERAGVAPGTGVGQPEGGPKEVGRVPEQKDRGVNRGRSTSTVGSKGNQNRSTVKLEAGQELARGAYIPKGMTQADEGATRNAIGPAIYDALKKTGLSIVGAEVLCDSAGNAIPGFTKSSSDNTIYVSLNHGAYTKGTPFSARGIAVHEAAHKWLVKAFGSDHGVKAKEFVRLAFRAAFSEGGLSAARVQGRSSFADTAAGEMEEYSNLSGYEDRAVGEAIDTTEILEKLFDYYDKQYEGTYSFLSGDAYANQIYEEIFCDMIGGEPFSIAETLELYGKGLGYFAREIFKNNRVIEKSMASEGRNEFARPSSWITGYDAGFNVRAYEPDEVYAWVDEMPIAFKVSESQSDKAITNEKINFAISPIAGKINDIVGNKNAVSRALLEMNRDFWREGHMRGLPENVAAIQEALNASKDKALMREWLDEVYKIRRMYESTMPKQETATQPAATTQNEAPVAAESAEQLSMFEQAPGAPQGQETRTESRPRWRRRPGKVSEDQLSLFEPIPKTHPEIQAKIDAANALKEKVLDYFKSVPTDSENYYSPEEIDTLMEIDQYAAEGDMQFGGEEIMSNLRYLAEEQTGEQRQQTFELMEEILPHLSVMQQGNWTEGRQGKAFSEWYNERHPSIYYPGYVPGKMNPFRERIFLRDYLQREDLQDVDRQRAQDLLTKLEDSRAGIMTKDERKALGVPDYGTFYKVDEDEPMAKFVTTTETQLNNPKSKLQNAFNKEGNAKADNLKTQLQKLVKPQEMQWTGLNYFFEQHKGQTVTKQDVLDFIVGNNIRIKQTGYHEGGQPTGVYTEYVTGETGTLENSLRRLARDIMWYPGDYGLESGEYTGEPLVTEEEMDGSISVKLVEGGPEITRLIPQLSEGTASWGGRDATQANYALTGGGNYREYTYQYENRKGTPYSNFSMNAHFGASENLIGHARVQDFTTPDGKTVLFIEEIQSDWANGRRKHGKLEDHPEYKALIDRENDLLGQASHLRNQAFGWRAQELRRTKKGREQVGQLREQYYEAQRQAETAHREAVDYMLNQLGWRLEAGVADGDYDVYGNKISDEKMDGFYVLDQNGNRVLEPVLKDGQLVPGHPVFNRSATGAAERAMEISEIEPPAPAMPFGDDYYKFILKDLLFKAANGDYDYIAWTTPEIQSHRYYADYSKVKNYQEYRYDFRTSAERKAAATKEEQASKAGPIQSFLQAYMNSNHWTGDMGLVELPNAGTVRQGNAVDIVVPAMAIDPKAKETLLYMDQPLYKAEEDAAYGTEREYAPVFYDKLTRIVEEKMPNKMGANQVESWLKGKGVKEEDIKWMGIRPFLEGKKNVTKDELLEFLSYTPIELEIDKVVLEGEDTRWSEHSVKGGRNPREILFGTGSKYTNGAMQAHWGDRTGVLAHARIQDMYLESAENGVSKTLFIDEIQSDWHNAGQKHGYASEKKWAKAQNEARLTPQKVKDEFLESAYAEPLFQAFGEGKIRSLIDSISAYEDLHPALEELRRIDHYAADEYFDAFVSTMEDVFEGEDLDEDVELPAVKAPFAKTYTDYVMKHLLRDAAENGYDAIAWTSADQQVARWNKAYRKGYQIEYDQDIPKFMRKLGEQWGATVEQIEMPDDHGKPSHSWYMALPEGLKNSVLYEGQPLFKAEDQQAAADAGVDLDEAFPEGSLERTLLEMIRSGKTGLAEAYITGIIEQSKNPTYTEEPDPTFTPVTDEELGTIHEAQETLIDRYGQLEPGEKPARDIRVAKQQNDKTRTRRHVPHVAESANVPEHTARALERFVATDEAASYVRITDKAATGYADNLIKTKGIEKCMQMWDGIASPMHKPTKNDIALGETLALWAAHNGRDDLACKIWADLNVMGTQAGQVVQAMSLIKKMSPEYQAYYIRKVVDDLNYQYSKKIQRGWNGMSEITIDPDLEDAVLRASTQEELNKAMDELITDIAKQVPASFKEKWDSWRYFAMLGNLRTHVRNVFGNAVFAPLVYGKNLMAAGLERFIPADQRTKSVTGKGKYREFARGDFEEMKDIITGEGNKYTSPRDAIMKKRQIWGTKAMNAATQFVGDALNIEDTWFLKPYYTDALCGYLAARNADIDALRSTPEGRKLLNEARQYAVLEAQKATYRDASVIAQSLNKMKKVPGIGWLLDGVLPFTGTPVNILRRGIEYSPIGLIKTLTYNTAQLANGQINASQYIDNLSTGMTGTMVAALGFWLAQSGILRGGDDDDDKREGFFKNLGFQNYAINAEINGKPISYTIDWMAPSALPLFTGAALYNLFARDNELSASDVFSALTLLAEPMMQLSMLDGLNRTLSSLSYADSTEMVSTLAIEMGTSYLGQAIPTILGQLARTMDGTRRSSYTDKNSDVPKWVQYFIQSSVQNKIPVWEEEKMAYIDFWGRRDTEASIALRAFENFISPGYYNEIKVTPVDEELNKLYEATGNSDIMPRKGSKYFSVAGERKDMTAKEFERYCEESGQVKYALLADLFSDSRYQNASDDVKIKLIEDMYKYANASTKYHIDSGYNLHGQGVWMENAEASGNVYESIMDSRYEKHVKDVGTEADAAVLAATPTVAGSATPQQAATAALQQQGVPVAQTTSGLASNMRKYYDTYVKQSGVSEEAFGAALTGSDTDGNGRVKQDEIGAYLNQQLREGNMSVEQAEAVWQGTGKANGRNWTTSYSQWYYKGDHATRGPGASEGDKATVSPLTTPIAPDPEVVELQHMEYEEWRTKNPGWDLTFDEWMSLSSEFGGGGGSYEPNQMLLLNENPNRYNVGDQATGIMDNYNPNGPVYHFEDYVPQPGEEERRMQELWNTAQQATQIFPSAVGDHSIAEDLMNEYYMGYLSNPDYEGQTFESWLNNHRDFTIQPASGRTYTGTGQKAVRSGTGLNQTGAVSQSVGGAPQARATATKARKAVAKKNR